MARFLFSGNIFLLTNLLLFSFELFSQKNTPVYDVKIHTGKVVQNWLSDSFPQRNASLYFEFNWAKQTLDSKSWPASYNFPQTGISFMVGSNGNPTELGYTFGVVPNVTFGTLNNRKWRIKLSLGMGLAYLTKPYDSITNKENVLIGSHITNLSYAQLYFQRQLNDKWTASFGFSTLHASNGHYQIPNVGMNIPCIAVGVKYYPTNRPKLPMETDTFVKIKNRIRINAKVGFGIHEFAETTKPIGGPKYNVYVGQLYLSRLYGRTSNVHAGFSWKYYTDYYKFLKDNQVFQENLHLKSSVFSFFLGHEFMFGQFAFLTQGALDLYFPQYIPYNDLIGKEGGFSYFVERYFSTRIGLQYYANNLAKNSSHGLFFGIYVNANFGEADFVETGIGYSF